MDSDGNMKRQQAARKGETWLSEFAYTARKEISLSAPHADGMWVRRFGSKGVTSPMEHAEKAKRSVAADMWWEIYLL